MDRFPKLSFRHRLLISPLLGVLLLSILVVVLLSLSWSQRQIWDHVTRLEAQVVEHSGGLMLNLAASHAAAHQLLTGVIDGQNEEQVHSDGAQLLRQLQGLKDALVDLQAQMVAGGPLSHVADSGYPESIDQDMIRRRIRETMIPALERYIGLVSGVVKESSADWRLANRHMRDADVDYGRLIRQFQLLMASMRAHLRHEMDRGLAIAGDQTLWILGLGVIFLPVMLLGGLRVYRTLTTDIQQIMDTIAELAGGHYERPVALIPHNQELQRISAGLERLRVALIRFDLEMVRRHKAQSSLRLSASVFESVAEGIMICDADNRIIAVNSAFNRITGYPEQEVLGKSADILRSGRHAEAFYRGIGEALERDGRWQGEIWERRRNGEVWPAWLMVSVIDDLDTGGRHYVSVLTDITELKASQERVEFLAQHDSLTGLPNRALFTDRLEHALQRAHREGARLAVLFIDLDRFKTINDSLGHPVGDELLKEVARRLSGLVREEDTVARLGGDEFVLILENISGIDAASVVARKVLADLSRPMHLIGHEIIITSSVGVGVYPEHGKEVTALIRNADTAMYQAKLNGRNDYQLYTDRLTKDADERLRLENDLRRAEERDEFELTYQPQVTLKDKRLVGVEALLYWRHPERGLISPDQFIPLAEDIGIIQQLGAWVLETACRDAVKWRDSGLGNLRLAVNLSSRQLLDRELPDKVDDILRQTGLPSRYLELEVTESAIMEQPERCIATLERIRALGISLAIDDFGTGYSSLSYLKRLPVQKVKIDREFVSDIPHDSDDLAIVSAVIAMSHSLGLTVVAEGMEKSVQLDCLEKYDCDEAQGYYVSRPLSASDFVQWVRKQGPWAVSGLAQASSDGG